MDRKTKSMDMRLWWIFGLYGQLRMQPTHFYKGIADGYHILVTIEEASKFGFGGRRSDKFDDLRYGED